MSWLSLTDYSTKYKVSVSTLRRRIKTDDIQFQFQDGRYFLNDTPPDGHQKTHRPSPISEDSSVAAKEAASNGLSRDFISMKQAALSSAHEVEKIQIKGVNTPNEDSLLLAANKLLNELKRAYTQILQEKEEQILRLKEEVSDLKTLVKVLESENSRQRR